MALNSRRAGEIGEDANSWRNMARRRAMMCSNVCRIAQCDGAGSRIVSRPEDDVGRQPTSWFLWLVRSRGCLTRARASWHWAELSLLLIASQARQTTRHWTNAHRPGGMRRIAHVISSPRQFCLVPSSYQPWESRRQREDVLLGAVPSLRQPWDHSNPRCPYVHRS